MSSKLHYNLTSGSSYMTQHSDDPEGEGEIIYNNLTAVAEILFGEEYTDEEMEIIIADADAGVFNAYDHNLDAEAAAKAVDARAKRSGGTGWLSFATVITCHQCKKSVSLLTDTNTCVCGAVYSKTGQHMF